MLNPTPLDQFLLLLGYTAPIWLPVLVLIVIAVAIILAFRRRSTNGAPSGFGGWLVIFALWEVGALAAAVLALGGSGVSGLKGPTGDPHIEALLDGLVLGATLTTLMLLVLRSRWTRWFVTLQAVANWLSFGLWFTHAPMALVPWALMLLGLSVLTNGAWIAYFARSVRARNTFIR